MRTIIIGGGLGGLTAAYYLKRERPEADVTVLERNPHPGGTARSTQVDGYTVDNGPNGFLTNVPETLELAHALGLSDELTPASDYAKFRYLLKDGTLHPLPLSPLSFFRSPLLSPRARARVMLEPFAPARDPQIDETVYDFAKRRLGREFSDVFISSMVLGITGGDAKELSLASLFPRMRAMEDDYGGLVKAMIGKGLEARKKKGEERGSPAGPGGRLTSFGAGGVERLVRALQEALGSSLQTSSEVSEIKRSAEAYTVRLADGKTLSADALVMAIPAFVTADLLKDVLPEAQVDLKSIPYAGVRVFGLGFNRADVPHPLTGFGYLVPRGQGLKTLGCLWTSSLFPQQAPEGKVLLRVIAGGVHDPDFVNVPDDEALKVVLDELRTGLGISAAPEVIHGVRWPKGIPQYTVGHAERVGRIMQAAAQKPGLYLTGNAYHGVGINDTVRDGKRVGLAVATTVPEGERVGSS